MRFKPDCAYYLGLFLTALCTDGYAAENELPTPVAQKTQTGLWLDAVPTLVDSLPTVFPEQSSEPITPDIEETKDNTWIDKNQYKFKQKLQNYAQQIDAWFGEPDYHDLASANLRIIFDNRWDKYNEYSIKPRIRGRIKLPTLENRLSVVFGDDSLDNEIRGNVAISNENPHGDSGKTLDDKQVRDDNSSLALRWEQWKNPWGLDSNIDLGIRSGDDVYVRVKFQKDWEIGNDFTTHAEQIYRYGLDSKNYLRTNLEIRHARPNQPFILNQLSLIYTDNDKQDFFWENRLFRQHQFFLKNWFNYGVFLGGRIDNNTPDLNHYGPFISWRQPFIREWLFIQSELTYYNDKEADHNHHLGTLLRLETWF